MGLGSKRSDFARSRQNQINQAAPGLFPPFSQKKSITNASKNSAGTSLYEEGCIDEESIEMSLLHRNVAQKSLHEDTKSRAILQQNLEKLPPNYKQDMINDKFYLTNFLTKKPVQFDDFKSYEEALAKEDILRKELKKHEQFSALSTVEKKPHHDSDDTFSEYGQRLNLVDDVENVFSSVTASGHKQKHQQAGAFRNIYTKLFASSHTGEDPQGLFSVSSTVRKDMPYTSQSLSHHLIDQTKSQPLTQVIGDPEYGFIEARMEKPKEKYFVTETYDPSDYITELQESVPSRQHPGRGGALPTRNTLKRSLGMRHLQMISLGATIGIGIFLNCGRTFSISGPLGAFLGFFIAACMIIGTLLCFAEIIAVIPLNVGISGVISRFISDAFGFSVSWCYLFSYVVSFPAELLAAVLLLSYYDSFENVINNNSKLAGVFIALTVIIIFVNLLDVRVYAEIEYVASIFKILVISAMVITMILINCGVTANRNDKSKYIGFKYWNRHKSPNENITYGPFRPTFDLSDLGTGALRGIGGIGGVVLSIIASVNVSSYAYIGSEIGFIAAAESKVTFRRSIPSVTKRIFIRVILFYLLSIFVLGLNIYAGDPRLLRYSATQPSFNAIYANYKKIVDELGGLQCSNAFQTNEALYFAENANQSPWIIALTTFNFCTLSSIFNALFVAIGLFAASSQLYAGSRILYSLAIQEKAPGLFATCNSFGIPYLSVLFCGCFGFLSLLALHLETSNALDNLVTIGTQGSILMWFAMNLAFYRFYHALKLRSDIVSRDSKEYPYRSPFQPYLSIMGMILTGLLLLFCGFQNFIQWNTVSFITSYCCLVVFLVLFLGFAIFRYANVWKLEEIDLDTGRRELDREIWVEDRDYLPTFRELLVKILSYI
ncbi:hypothetical protein ACO0QE_002545 [Hanseniaspora vineae]